MEESRKESGISLVQKGKDMRKRWVAAVILAGLLACSLPMSAFATEEGAAAAAEEQTELADEERVLEEDGKSLLSASSEDPGLSVMEEERLQEVPSEEETGRIRTRRSVSGESGPESIADESPEEREMEAAALRSVEESDFQAEPSDSLEAGIYTISLWEEPSLFLAVSGDSLSAGANVELHQAGPDHAQKFQVEALGNGFYQIRSLLSGKLLDVHNSSVAEGTNVQQWNENGMDAQEAAEEAAAQEAAAQEAAAQEAARQAAAAQEAASQAAMAQEAADQQESSTEAEFDGCLDGGLTY